MSRDLEAGFQNFFASYAKGQKKHGETAITISPCYFSSGWNFTMSSAVKKLAERIQGIGGDGFVRLHPADGRTADTGLGLQGICGCTVPLHGLPQGLV